MDPFRFMRDTFPDVRFIINTRSHERTAQSGWWKSIPYEAVVRQLIEAEELFDRVSSTFPKVTLKMHFDDYSTRPEELKKLFDFLDEPFDAEEVRNVLNSRLLHTGVKELGS